MAKLVITRLEAQDDARRVIDYYLREHAPHAAERFADVVAHACEQIGLNPGRGSPRYAHELKPPGLRAWGLKPFPHYVLYLEQPDHVMVWRVLHPQRDIPTLMRTGLT